MNYKKIYSQAIKTLLKGQPLPLHIGEVGTVFPTDTTINKKTKACLLKTANGEDYAHFICETFLEYFDKDAEIKVNPKAEISPFYIYENGELAGIIAPIRQKK